MEVTEERYVVCLCVFHLHVLLAQLTVSYIPTLELSTTTQSALQVTEQLH